MQKLNIPYKKEKVENAICFFAYYHLKKTKQPLFQTALYKYLAFLDFKGIEKNGQPILGLKYQAMDRGPVPIDIYGKRSEIKSNCFNFVADGNGGFIIESIGKPDLDYFSKFEQDEMNNLIDIFATSFAKTKHFSDASHEQIKAWKKAYKDKPNSIIDYSLTFKENPSGKTEDQLSFPEEVYKTLVAFQNPR
jgi:hypothetical protein